ncbi:E3 ubiquitin ligase SCF complex, Skp subunit [Rhizoclosmatium globosum]|uniref:E3 ubiquitin ligase complex SCF subunit n=1 Tax=Rhizoclosmatium globosum TaxID=329046 RepID=A0A1Y2CZ50_9FUNG|nr:E3 ubiquitin ligase SCF complex, Skp subunit [Rhizoclosmatium globosum]|eukprot:ORY52280.1 E3 ubiquitin ligase SCF complex, Skp subunit [Rhizoclosmatium globosum]
MVKITSSDNQEFNISKEIANQSVLIKNMLEDVGEADDQPIPLPNVSGAILQKVRHHAQRRPPAAPEEETKPKSSEDIEERDKEFMNVDQGTLFEIILAANYLDMKNLLDLGCKTVANMIKGKSVEEIRKTFNIVNDFTPEEEEQIRKENEWCEDR